MKSLERVFNALSKFPVAIRIVLKEFPSVGNLPREGIPQCRLAVRKLSKIRDKVLILSPFTELQLALL